MADFQSNLTEYMKMTKRRAVYRELLSHLADYVSSDTRGAQKTIIEKEGDVVITVDEATIEDIISVLTEEFEALSTAREELS